MKSSWSGFSIEIFKAKYSSLKHQEETLTVNILKDKHFLKLQKIVRKPWKSEFPQNSLSASRESMTGFYSGSLRHEIKLTCLSTKKILYWNFIFFIKCVWRNSSYKFWCILTEKRWYRVIAPTKSNLEHKLPSND